MSAPPYQKLFWGSYHKHTAHLTHAREHGAFLLLIGALWNNGGRLPADDEILAGYAKLSLKEWAAVKPKLMPMFRIVRGKFSQPRVSEDLAKFESISCKRKSAGKAGGSASRGKTTANSQANARQKPPYSESESESEDTHTLTAHDERANDLRRQGDEAKAAAGDALASMATCPGIANLAPLRALLSGEKPCDWTEDVLPAIGSAAAWHRSRDGPGSMRSWTTACRIAVENRDRRLSGPPAPKVIEFSDARRSSEPPVSPKRAAHDANMARAYAAAQSLARDGP